MSKPYSKEQWLLEQMQVLEQIHLPILLVKECLSKLSPEVFRTYLLLLVEEKIALLSVKQRAFKNILSQKIERTQHMELFSLAERLNQPPLLLKQHLETLEQFGLLRKVPQTAHSGLQEGLQDPLYYFELLDYRLQKMWNPGETPPPLKEKQSENTEKLSKSHAIHLPLDESYQQFYQSLQGRFLTKARVGQWQQLVYRLHFELHLEKEVIFQLFLEAEQKQALTVAYLTHMGELYAQEGVKTFSDLEQFKAEFEQFNQFVKRLQKFLNRRSAFTELEREHIQKWFKNWGFEEEAIFVLIKHLSTRSQNMTIHFIESVLEKYRSKKAFTATLMETAIQEEQAAFRLEKEKRQNQLSQNQSAPNVANFSQRPFQAVDEHPDYWKRFEEEGEV